VPLSFPVPTNTLNVISKKMTNRAVLIITRHSINLFDTSKPGRIFRYYASRQRPLHLPRRDHVITPDIFDSLKFALCGDVYDQDNLNRFATPWNID
jgi:hypothetical protein